MSVYNLAFRAGIPLGSLALGKLIPIFGVSGPTPVPAVFSSDLAVFPDRNEKYCDLSESRQSRTLTNKRGRLLDKPFGFRECKGTASACHKR